MAARKKAVNFEQSLGELENLVQSLESGDLTLDQALAAFEKGVKLTRECQQTLNDAEQKIETLIKSRQTDIPSTLDGAIENEE